MADFTDSIGRLYGRQLGRSVPVGEIESGIIAAPHMRGGIVRGVGRDELPVTSGRRYVNARIREDWIGRRPGTGQIGDVPHAEPVLAVIRYVRESQDTVVFRISESGFHQLSADNSTWEAFSVEDEDGNAATFPADARFSIAQFFDNLYMADGFNKVWEVNVGNKVVKQIADAPRASFVVNFAERIVAAGIRQFVGGERPATVQWPVNADPLDWSGEGSGLEDLAARDIGDAITGLVSTQRGALIFRRKSIWIMSRQPFQIPTFRFQPFVEGVGCDLPHSIAKIPGGVIFADQRTSQVFTFSEASGPRPIGNLVDDLLYQDLSRLDFAQGSYDPFEKEYHLGLVFGEGESYMTRTWIYSLEDQAWTFDDSPEVSTIGVVNLPGESLAIDALTGTIDAQTVTIDEYGADDGIRPALFKGTPTGEVIQQDYSFDHDWDGTRFEFLFKSQNLGDLQVRRSVKDLAVRTLAESGGEVMLEESNEDGKWRFLKRIGLPARSVKTNVRIAKKGITGEDLFFRVRSTAPGVQFFSWFARVVDKGLQR